MPTVFRVGAILFFFTSYDCIEPIHIHAVEGNKECKYWIRNETDVVMADNAGFSASELKKLKRSISQNIQLITDTWNEHCKNTQAKEYKTKS